MPQLMVEVHPPDGLCVCAITEVVGEVDGCLVVAEEGGALGAVWEDGLEVVRAVDVDLAVIEGNYDGLLEALSRAGQCVCPLGLGRAEKRTRECA